MGVTLGPPGGSVPGVTTTARRPTPREEGAAPPTGREERPHVEPGDGDERSKPEPGGRERSPGERWDRPDLPTYDPDPPTPPDPTIIEDPVGAEPDPPSPGASSQEEDDAETQKGSAPPIMSASTKRLTAASAVVFGVGGPLVYNLINS
jgi:hypothetical protein